MSVISLRMHALVACQPDRAYRLCTSASFPVLSPGYQTSEGLWRTGAGLLERHSDPCLDKSVVM